MKDYFWIGLPYVSEGLGFSALTKPIENNYTYFTTH